MKKLFFATILSAAAFVGTAAVLILNADFKGEWAFNEGKSKLAEGRFRMNATSVLPLLPRAILSPLLRRSLSMANLQKALVFAIPKKYLPPNGATTAKN